MMPEPKKIEFICRVHLDSVQGVRLSAADRYFIPGSFRAWRVIGADWEEKSVTLERCTWRELFTHWRDVSPISSINESDYVVRHFHSPGKTSTWVEPRN